jgi:hypothetical protein
MIAHTAVVLSRLTMDDNFRTLTVLAGGLRSARSSTALSQLVELVVHFDQSEEVK